MSELLYSGKSKSVYGGEDENNLVIRYTDTATALNGKKKEELSGKGRLNMAISNRLYAYLADNGIKTHLIKEIDDTAILVRKAEVIQVEVIVRNIAAGGFSKKYGVPEGTALKNTVVEFCYKNDDFGDPMMNESQITAIGLAEADELAEMARQALAVNDLLSALLLKTDITLVDFKLEFGRCGGEIILCDEISPDSCRFWDVHTGRKLDKDRFRNDLGGVLDGYRDVLERLRGALDGGEMSAT